MYKCYINDTDAKSILLDCAAELTTKVDEFVEDNIYQVRLMLNTWGALLDDVDQRNSTTLFTGVLPIYGLIGTIKLASSIADELIGCQFMVTDEAVEVADLRGNVHAVAVDDFVRAMTHTEDPAVILQLLRFPKRFSPLCADRLEKESLKEFKQLQNLAFLRNRRNWDDYVIRSVALRCADLLRGYEPLMRNPDKVFAYGEYSNGNSTDASDKALCNKLFSWRGRVIAPSIQYPAINTITIAHIQSCDWHPEEFDYYWDFPYIDHLGYKLEYVFGAMVNAVPKNYKSARIIAKEDSTRNYAMSAIRKEMLRCVTLNCRDRAHQPIVLEDQSPNQLAAFLGSMDSSYATVDLSSASDTICVACARAILPTPVYRDIQAMRAQFVLEQTDNGLKASRNNIWLTSGCTVTFVSMSTILVAAADFACDLYRMAYPEAELKDPIVYGDDCCVDTRVYDTFNEVITRLGFKVNEAKSFGPGTLYRESCGVEYYDGIDLSTKYWPRQSLKDPSKKENLVRTYAAIVDLQHKFYDCMSCRATLTREATRLLKKMKCDLTFCLPVDSHAALWGDLPSPTPATDKSYLPGFERPCLEYHVVGSKPGRVPKDLHSNPRYLNYLMRKYTEYLCFGPELSDDPLMRMLGITQSRIHPGDFGGGSPSIIRVKDC